MEKDIKVKSKDYYKKLFSKSDWSYETLEAADDLFHKINDDTLGLSIYPNQYEIVTAEQMLDAYSLTGLPVSYDHWKFGKDFAYNESKYKRGQMGLSYEMVINSSPCISYNMEENTTCLMVLVLVHLNGHNSFFKNNYMFKQWTQAESILDYMKFAKRYVSDCEERYGYDEVEAILDAAHSLSNYGVSKYKAAYSINVDDEVNRVDKGSTLSSDLWRTLPTYDVVDKTEEKKFPKNAEENILYFIEKNSPILKDWQRELIRIVRKISQYFYPQGQTKVLNEGVATMTHYLMVNEMFDQGYLSDGFMIEFIKHHSGVIFQPDFDSPYYSGFNPYTLGFKILMDVKRMCENPTDEDIEWFPNVVNKDFKKMFHHIMENYKDDTFIAQYLSPKVIRDLKLFLIKDEASNDRYYSVDAIHNKKGYNEIREKLSARYNRSVYVPDVQVYNVDILGDRKLTLKYTSYDGRELDEGPLDDVIHNVKFLWGFDVDIV